MTIPIRESMLLLSSLAYTYITLVVHKCKLKVRHTGVKAEDARPFDSLMRVCGIPGALVYTQGHAPLIYMYYIVW